MNLQSLILTLAPTPAEAAAIDATIDAFGQARAHAASVGQRSGTTSPIVIQRLCYHDLRAGYGLSANLAIRVIACAARQLRGDTAEMAAHIEYDARTLSFNNQGRHASLSTTHGRLRKVQLHLNDTVQHALVTGHLVHAALHRKAYQHYVLAVTLATPPTA